MSEDFSAHRLVYERLVELITGYRPSLIIETGTAAGVGTRILRDAAAPYRGKVITVDLAKPVRDLDDVVYIRADSRRWAEKWSDPVGLVFVDCCFSNDRTKVAAQFMPHADVVVVDDTKLFPLIPGLLPQPTELIDSPQGASVWINESAEYHQ